MAMRLKGMRSAQVVATTTSSPRTFPAEVTVCGSAIFEFEPDEGDHAHRLAVRFGTKRQVLKTIHAERRLGPSFNYFSFDYPFRVPRPDDYVFELLVDGIEVASTSLAIPVD